MSGIQIVGQNQTTTNSALKITNSNKITYNDDEGENRVCKAIFWGFLFLCVLVFLFILRNKNEKGKTASRIHSKFYQRWRISDSLNIAVLPLADSDTIKTVDAKQK